MSLSIDSIEEVLRMNYNFILYHTFPENHCPSITDLIYCAIKSAPGYPLTERQIVSWVYHFEVIVANNPNKEMLLGSIIDALTQGQGEGRFVCLNDTWTINAEWSPSGTSANVITRVHAVAQRAFRGLFQELVVSPTSASKLQSSPELKTRDPTFTEDVLSGTGLQCEMSRVQGISLSEKVPQFAGMSRQLSADNLKEMERTGSSQYASSTVSQFVSRTESGSSKSTEPIAGSDCSSSGSMARAGSGSEFSSRAGSGFSDTAMQLDSITTELPQLLLESSRQ